MSVKVLHTVLYLRRTEMEYKKKRKRRNEKEEKEMKRKKRQRGRRTHDLHLDTGMPSGTVPTMPSANTIGDTGLTL